MGWHVRFFSQSLKQELISPEMESEEAALAKAWTLAQNGEDVTAIEGPDGERVPGGKIDMWFREHGKPAADKA